MGTNFERMKAEATQRIDAMTANDRMAIIAFNDKATLLTQPSSDKEALKAAVSVARAVICGYTILRSVQPCGPGVQPAWQLRRSNLS